jgi:hypothetical protein
MGFGWRELVIGTLPVLLLLVLYQSSSGQVTSPLPTTDNNSINYCGEEKVPAKPAPGTAGQDYLSQTNATNIEEYLKYLTSVPHMGGTPADYDQAEYLRKLWLDQGFDHAMLNSYEVLLSLPGTEIGPSHVQILDESGSVKFTSAMYETPITPHTEYDEDLVPPAFLAYSASGTIVSDELIYANYGLWEDFVHLTRDLGISVQDKLVMIRYGKVYRGNKLKWAEVFGAKGAIVYSDPADYHPELGREDPYPNSWWLPDSGIQRGTIEWVDGDQSTPIYPAIDGAYRYTLQLIDHILLMYVCLIN